MSNNKKHKPLSKNEVFEKRFDNLLKSISDFLQDTSDDKEIYESTPHLAAMLVSVAATAGGDSIFESIGILEQAKYTMQHQFANDISEQDENSDDDESSPATVVSDKTFIN